MANNIKGITVEINGETGPLQNALKDVNKTSYALKSELREVEKALKLDPSNAVLLAQKQELLAKSITNAKEKLETLKQAEIQAQAAFARGEISAEQYRALQREVVNTQGALDDLESRAKKSNDTLKNVAESAAKMGDKVIVAGVAAVGTALIGTAVAGVTMGDELTKALNGVQADTGAADGSMDGLKNTMLNIYSNNFGEDFADIGASMSVVAQSTGLAGEALESATTNALLLRDTFGFEVADSIKSVSQMMNQFGMTSEQAYNMIAQGAQQGLDKNGDLLDTINEYSGTFKAQGFSAEEMFNMLSNASKSGIRDVDLAADAIKEFGIRSKDGSSTTAEGFKALGLDAKKMTKAFGEGGDVGKKAFADVTSKLVGMKDPVAQTAAGVALFGTQFEDLGIKGITALVNTKGKVDETKDALKGINEVKYNSFGEGIEGIRRQLITELALPIGEDLLPKLNEFSGELKEKLPSVITSLKPIIQSLIDKVVFLASHLNIIIPVLATVLGGFIALSVISKTITMVNTITKAFSFLTLAKLKDIAQTTILNGLYAKDAIVKATRMVGDLTRSLVLLGVGKLKDIAQTTLLGALYVKDSIVKGASAVAQGALTVATGIWNIVCGIATGVTAGLGIAFAFLTSPIGLVVLAIAAVIAIGVLLYKNWDLIMAKAAPIFEGIKTIIVTVLTAISAFVSMILNGIKTIILTVFTIIKGLILLYVMAWVFIIRTAFEVIKTVITTVLNVIRAVITTIFTVIKNIFITYVNFWKTVITLGFNIIKTVITTIITVVKTVITTVFNAIKSVITNVFNGIKIITTTVWGFIQSIISNAINGAKNTVSNVTNGIKSTVTNIWNSIKSTTTNVWNGIKNAIMNPINSAKDGVSNAINSIKGFFSNIRLPEIRIPKIKMPHFGLTGEFSLMPPKVPKLNIDWYDKGGIFNTPNIIGVGEKRPEFVGALDDLREIVREESGKGNGSVINFNGSYTFADKKDIDYFMNESAKIVQRRK